MIFIEVSRIIKSELVEKVIYFLKSLEKLEK